MKHLHKASGLVFECGELMEFPVNGTRKTYDMTVITLWQHDEEEASPPIIIDYYFGEYNKSDTDYYIDRWFEKQSTSAMWRKFVGDCKAIVDAYWITNHEVLDEPYRNKVQTVRTGLEAIVDSYRGE